MTYSDDFTLPKEYLEQMAEGGMEYKPELIRILLNAAMRAERQKHLGVAPYERSPERKGRQTTNGIYGSQDSQSSALLSKTC